MPWIIQVLDPLFQKSTYRVRRLQALPSVAGCVFDEAAYPVFYLLIPVRLASDQVFFIRIICYHTFINTFGKFHALKHVYGLKKKTRNQRPEHTLAYTRC